MKSIQIKNLRSIRDSNEIPLSGINILLGPNSTGKSSLLRSFPLIKQSFESATSSPILWYGRLVDFGSIKEAKNFDHPDEPISFRFGIPVRDLYRAMRRNNLRVPSNTNSEEVFYYSVSIEPKSDHGSSIKEVQIDIFESQILIKFNGLRVTNITVNGVDHAPLYEGKFYNFSGKLVPSLYFRPDKETTANRSEIFEKYLLSLSKLFVHNRTSEESLSRVIRGLGIASLESSIDTFIRMLNPSNPDGAKAKINLRKADFIKFKNGIDSLRLPLLLKVISERIESFFLRSLYIGPSRATGNRYYRHQDLAVNEVDFQGENLLMYLESLNGHELESFNRFCKKYFEFEIMVDAQLGHSSIKIKDGSKPYFNLIDLGFGYSQLIPVITQVWHSLYRSHRRRGFIDSDSGPIVLSIEQPELHLHPKLQSKLATLFYGILEEAKSINKELVLFIETHSEALVNTFGNLIADSHIGHEQIHIWIFENNNTSKQLEIVPANFDSDGILKNWPYGFFSYSTLD